MFAQYQYDLATSHDGSVLYFSYFRPATNQDTRIYRWKKDAGVTLFGDRPDLAEAPPLRAQHLYGAFVVNERHRHRYEFNNTYRAKFEEAGMIFSGTSPDGKLVEIIELRDHPFFLASQFHPEFQSKPNKPHPLFKGFIAASHHNIHHRPL